MSNMIKVTPQMVAEISPVAALAQMSQQYREEQGVSRCWVKDEQWWRTPREAPPCDEPYWVRDMTEREVIVMRSFEYLTAHYKNPKESA